MAYIPYQVGHTLDLAYVPQRGHVTVTGATGPYVLLPYLLELILETELVYIWSIQLSYTLCRALPGTRYHCMVRRMQTARKPLGHKYLPGTVFYYVGCPETYSTTHTSTGTIM